MSSNPIPRHCWNSKCFSSSVGTKIMVCLGWCHRWEEILYFFLKHFFSARKRKAEIIVSTSEIPKEVCKIGHASLQRGGCTWWPGLLGCVGQRGILQEPLGHLLGSEQRADFWALTVTDGGIMICGQLGQSSTKVSHPQRGISLLPLWSPDRSHPYVSVSLNLCRGMHI